MTSLTKVVLAGINGYGRFYLDDLLDHAADHRAELVGVADPCAERSERFDTLRERGIPVYGDLVDFYADRRADLAVISTPIQCHCAHTLTALENGSNVLCEKPLCATVDEAERMLEGERAHSECFVAVGYNRSFSPAVQAVKADVMNGVYGAPVMLQCLVSWPRSKRYFGRNNWAGKLKGDRGEWILDSPLNNATAHFLHNMFYLCGERVDYSARVGGVEAELYRANAIESFDTCAVRCTMSKGWTALFYTTHAAERSVGPISRYVFERGVIECGDDSRFVGVVGEERKEYPADPGMDGHANKLWQCVARCRGEAGAVCGISAALETTRVVNAAHLSMPRIVSFGPSMIRERSMNTAGVTQCFVPGLLDMLLECYEKRVLPSEHGAVDFARAGRVVDVANFGHFDPPFSGDTAFCAPFPHAAVLVMESGAGR